MTTDQKRRRLIQIAAGHEDKVLLMPLDYLLTAIPVEVAEAYGIDIKGCDLITCEPDAVQTICSAIEAREAARMGIDTNKADEAAERAANGVKWQAVCTWEHYDDSSTDEEIKEAMRQRPCLVNYGGVLRAVNVDADEVPAIILKDMQAGTEAAFNNV